MQEHVQKALDFLKKEFHPDLDYNLKLESTFNRHPLKGDLNTSLFSFDVHAENLEHFYIFAGDTACMIYPEWNLTPDELWAVHLGLEYFIEQGVTEDTERKPHLLLTYLKMVATVFQEQLYILKPESIKVDKVYKFNEQRHVVGHAEFNGKIYSWIVGDITHFVYKKDLPPHVIWALHMGRILLT
jgi:hypothetical protein